MRRTFSYMGLHVMGVFALFFAWSASVHAAPVEVKSLACAQLAIQDGSTQDWFDYDIPFLVKNDTTAIEGTTYYYDGTEWNTTKPVNPLYSINMDKWLDVLSMKFCTTGENMRMYAKTDFPMMMVYNHEDKKYQSIHEPVNMDQEGENFTPEFLSMPAELDGWMVWKMQKKENPEEKPIYFAANIVVSEGEPEQDSQGGPSLYLYRESNQKDFEKASFNPNKDTLITEVEVSDDHNCEGEECATEGPKEATGKENNGFEVEQSISAVYKNSEIAPTDVVNISMATYDTSDFGSSSLGFLRALADTTTTKALQFAKVGPTKVKAITIESTSVKLGWKFKKHKSVESYTVRILDEDGKKVKQKMVSGKKKVKIKGLESGTVYNAVVRANKKNGKKSSWSSALLFTTD